MNGGRVLRTLSCRPKRIVAGLVGKPDVCDKGGRQFQYYCLLRFVVTPAMAPKVIIVFSQKDLSGDVYTWAVASRPKNTVHLKFLTLFNIRHLRLFTVEFEIQQVSG